MFAHHPPLPCAAHFSDEGAANHTRLCRAYDEPGLEIFVFGRVAFDPSIVGPREFPARQTLEASQAIARNHQLDPKRVLFVQQSPAAIDAGAFHNDVVAVGNRNVLLHHDRAFTKPWPDEQWKCYPAKNISLAGAVGSYIFNSQLLTLPDGTMTLVAPAECRNDPSVLEYIDSLVSGDTEIKSVHYVNVRQSMQNGGGPACLRLRIVLTDDELKRTHQHVLLTDALCATLQAWIEKHYRESIAPRDLADPKLLDECRRARRADADSCPAGDL